MKQFAQIVYRRLRATSAFSPLRLFAAGEQGVWYDPSDMTTLFQDAAGTTPVTAVEQPVGLMLDKSKGLVLGPELVTNGDFSAGSTGWTTPAGWTIGGGAAVAAATTSSLYGGGVTPVAGRSYRVDFDVVSYTSGDLLVTVGGNFSGNPRLTSAQLAPGRKSVLVIAGSSPSRGVEFYGGSITATIDNISVRELPGNHATQSTSASRPVLSARVNLLTRTEEFDNAAWTRNNIAAFGSGSVANTTDTTDPLGGNTADKLVENTTTSEHSVGQNAIPASSAFVLSAYVKAAGRTICYLRSKNAAGTYTNVFFDISSGTVLTVGADWLDAAITSVGNGWYRISARRASTASPPNFASIGMTTTDDVISSVGDGTSGIYIWGADLRPANAGVNLPAYQRVGAATAGTSTTAGNADYDTNGFPMYLKFDGTDDSMATGTINPGSVDKAQVFAGVRKLAADAPSGGSASVNVVAELSASSTSNAGTIAIGAPWDAINNRFFWRSGGTTRQQSGTTSTIYNSPFTGVLRCIGDISGDIVSLTINGTQAAQSTADQGTGNYGSYPLFIGRRGGTLFPFNGHLYSLVVRFSATNLPDATIAQTETWVNGKTKAY